MEVMITKPTMSEKPAETISPWELRKRLTFAILGSFSLSDNIPDVIATNVVYSAFHQLKNKYPRWLGSLYFEISGNTMSCKHIEDILFSLGAFGLVTVENHDFRRLRFNEVDRKMTKAKVRMRTENAQSLEELEDLSNEFSKIIQTSIDAST